MVLALEHEPSLEVLHAPGTVLAYLAFNTRDPVLKDVRVRQAMAYAIDRAADDSLFAARFCAARLQPASSGELGIQRRCFAYDHNPDRAGNCSTQAGYSAVNGVRFHLTMKTSTDESTRG